MKIRFVCSLLALLILCSSCASSGGSENTQPPEMSEETVKHLDKDTLLQYIVESEERWAEGITVESDLQVLRTEACSLSAGQDASCTLFRIDGYIWGIGIEIGANVAIQHISNTSFEENKLYFADIDADGCDEIIALFGTSAAAGPSRYAAIYKWQESVNALTLLYSNDGAYQGFGIDQGFGVMFADGYRCIVENQYTGDRYVYDARRDIELPDFIFDADGVVDRSHSLYDTYFQRETLNPDGDRSNNFLIFEPVDIDADGVFEIRAVKRFYWEFQTAVYIGDAATVLRYHPEQQTFEVIRAEFVPLPKAIMEESSNP